MIGSSTTWGVGTNANACRGQTDMTAIERKRLPPGFVSGLLFFAVVLLGCAYIAYAKLHEFPAFYVTSVPVGIMLAYAALLGFARLFRLRDDQSGDNLYYMGF